MASPSQIKYNFLYQSIKFCPNTIYVIPPRWYLALETQEFKETGTRPPVGAKWPSAGAKWPSEKLSSYHQTREVRWSIYSCFCVRVMSSFIKEVPLVKSKYRPLLRYTQATRIKPNAGTPELSRFWALLSSTRGCLTELKIADFQINKILKANLF